MLAQLLTIIKVAHSTHIVAYLYNLKISVDPFHSSSILFKEFLVVDDSPLQVGRLDL
jgi:hypothetical protein